MIGFGLPYRLDVGCELTYEFLVDAFDGNFRRGNDFELQSFRGNDVDGVRITYRQNDFFALLNGFVTDAVDDEVFGVTFSTPSTILWINARYSP